MPKISVMKIMKIIDEIERKTTKTKKQRSGSVTAKRFCCVFNLGFVQFMCKASLIFKSNLELALSIISLKKRIIRVKT